MNKGKFLLFAGILGLAFTTAFVSMAAKGESKIHPAEEISFREANHNDDELGLKILHFEEKEGEGEKKTGAAPARQWEDKDTGFVIFGVLMGVSAIMIGTMVTLSILKKKRNHNAQEEQQ